MYIFHDAFVDLWIIQIIKKSLLHAITGPLQVHGPCHIEPSYNGTRQCRDSVCYYYNIQWQIITGIFKYSSLKYDIENGRMAFNPFL